MIARLHIAAIPLAAFVIWTIAVAQGTAAVDDAIAVFEKNLPAGWSVAVRKANEYPWGHHFCDDYSGSNGTKITVVGPQPVSVNWVARTGELRQTPIANESLELWFMPPDYRDSWTAWLCVHRPIQPIEVLSNSRVRVYGSPSHRLNSEDEFRRQVLEQAQSVSWPGSPVNDRSALSWSTWIRDIEGSVRKGISK